MNLADLKTPFPEKDVEWRIGRSGITNNKPWALALAYITARAAQDRLDDVFGPGGWQDHYEHVQGGVMCTISAKIGDEWVAKQNGSDGSDIEAFKGGISGAFKRAAVNWGIGRYLYDLSESFVTFSEDKTGHSAKIEGKYYNWIPPKLPPWALPVARNNGGTGPTRKPNPDVQSLPTDNVSFSALTPPDLNAPITDKTKAAIVALVEAKFVDPSFISEIMHEMWQMHPNLRIKDLNEGCARELLRLMEQEKAKKIGLHPGGRA